MTRNFRKPNHTKASGDIKGKVCASCHRKLPAGEFSDSWHIRRRMMMLELKGPRYRTVERQFTRCRVCRSLPHGYAAYLSRHPGLRTPIRLAMQGLPNTWRWAMGF